MKYIFWGTPIFANYILEKLISYGFPPALVVTNPDAPVGRKKIMTPPPVKITAEAHGIPVLQPEQLKSSIYEIQNTKYDVFVVAAYGKILPKEILDLPRLGTINVHPSLLPRHRGPTPIQNTILSGDEETGVTLILLDEKVDHGPILTQRELNSYQLPVISYQSLEEDLAELGGALLTETLPKFLEGEIKPVPQDHTKATFTKKFTSEDGFVSQEDLEAALSGDKNQAVLIDRKIRALNPEPGVWTIFERPILKNVPINKRVKLLEAEVVDGKLVLKKIQVEGSTPRVISH